MMHSPLAQPLISFGQVRHHRLRPADNRFSYGVFTLMLPLRALGSEPLGNRVCSRNRFNLMSFHDRDHGDGKTPLLPWIDSLLQEEGIHDANGEIWLQCFPRILGYVFNPVSFWFCHRADGALRAILCEVNNTFGERHCYLLDSGADMPWGQALTTKKVFHVSPFCAVEGDYHFRFMRSAQNLGSLQTERLVARIDYHDARGPLLLTSISGALQTLTTQSALLALVRHPLMTFSVVARIHWQAIRLLIRRVPFFKKPQPPARSLSR
jgi:DUF1365 family protein